MDGNASGQRSRFRVDELDVLMERKSAEKREKDQLSAYMELQTASSSDSKRHRTQRKDGKLQTHATQPPLRHPSSSSLIELSNQPLHVSRHCWSTTTTTFPSPLVQSTTAATRRDRVPSRSRCSSSSFSEIARSEGGRSESRREYQGLLRD